jgi:hypothetical protein
MQKAAKSEKKVPIKATGLNTDLRSVEVSFPKVHYLTSNVTEIMNIRKMRYIPILFKITKCIFAVQKSETASRTIITSNTLLFLLTVKSFFLIM